MKNQKTGIGTEEEKNFKEAGHNEHEKHGKHTAGGIIEWQFQSLQHEGWLTSWPTSDAQLPGQ